MDTKTVIIAGSRTITDYEVVRQAIESSPWFGSIDTVHVGDAKGVDALALLWCKRNGITYHRFIPEWDEWGKAAGPMRNEDMVHLGGEALILIWDGKSKGSANMKRIARRRHLPIHEVVIGGG